MSDKGGKKSFSELLQNAFAQGGDDFAQLCPCRAIRRHQHNHISDGSRQHAAPGHRLANADARALAQGKRLACAPVFDKFDAGNQARLPDVADVGQLPELFQLVAQNGFEFLPRADGFLASQNFQAGKRRRRAELVAGVAVSVKEGFEFVIFAEKGVEDCLAW